MSSLYSIVDGQLRAATRRALMKESLIEDWVAADPSLLVTLPLGLDEVRRKAKNIRFRAERRLQLLALGCRRLCAQGQPLVEN